MEINRRALASHLGAFVVGAVVTTTLVAQAVPATSGEPEPYSGLDVFAQSLAHIVNDYADPVDESVLMYGAVRGMVRQLDQYSEFLSPEAYQRLRQDTQGEFVGVGLTLRDSPVAASEPGALVVDAVAPSSPASRAGIVAGDQLLAIDGRSTSKLPVNSNGKPEPQERAMVWHSQLRGLSGTRVKLRVLRASWSEPRSFVLVREHIKIPSVQSFTVEPGIGYIAISKFQEATATDVAAALTDLDKDGLDALILDLRGNLGGLVDQAIQVADLFLDQGTIVIIRGRLNTKAERKVARSPGTWSQVRLLVLIDHNSASATEIVAGALQDHGRATIMGLQSYGKASVQTFIDLEDGSGLKLTTARYYTPLDRTLEVAGITPDIKVPAFAGDVIVAGQPDERDIADEARKAVSIRDRLAGDHQFAIAHQTVRAWLGSKQAGRER